MFCLTSLHLKLLLWYRRDLPDDLSQKVITEAVFFRALSICSEEEHAAARGQSQQPMGWKHEPLAWRTRGESAPSLEFRSLSNHNTSNSSLEAFNQWLFSFRLEFVLEGILRRFWAQFLAHIMITQNGSFQINVQFKRLHCFVFKRARLTVSVSQTRCWIIIIINYYFWILFLDFKAFKNMLLQYRYFLKLPFPRG